MFSETFSLLEIALLLFGAMSDVQSPKNPKSHEQTSFGVDPPKMDRPVNVPIEVLKLLRKNEYVLHCVKEGESPIKIRANWFVGSEIRLSHSAKDGLVVQARFMDQGPSDNACLYGANIGPFWVFNKTSRGYELMLEAHSIGLEVLNERTNGIRDIEIAAVVAHSYVNSICYKYDGHTYQIAKRTSVPIGEEAPRDLSNYETREPLAQLPGQDAAQILEQARDWIWQNLQRHKLSYLSVSTNGSDGTEANFTFFINKSETGQWQVVARVHKVVLEQASPSEPPRKIIEDELWSTDKVQRIDPKSEDPLNPRVFSDTEILSPERFRLRFLDFGGFELLIL